VQVTYRLEEEDYRALAHYLLHHTPRGRLILRRGLIWALILSFIAGTLIYSVRPDLILSVLFGACSFVFMMILRRRTALIHEIRIYGSIRPQDDRRMNEPGTLALTPEHLEAHYGKGEGKFPWRSVSQIGHDENHIFIILGRVNAFAVPKRDFESPEAFQTFYNQAREYHRQSQTTPN
jgi:hypothetical protein